MWKNVIATAALVSLTAIPALAGGIGVFNGQQTIAQSEVSKAAHQYVQSHFDAEGKKLEKQFQDLQKQGQAFQTQAAAMSQKAREEKQMELMRKGRDLEQKRRTFAAQVDRTNAQLSQVMMRLASAASQEVAKKLNLDLIFNESTGAVAYYNADKLDVNKEMLSELNNQWKKMGSKFPDFSKQQARK